MTTHEAMFVIQLMKHKWDAAPPRPAFRTLAKRMEVEDTAIRGYARSLEKKGLLVRIRRVGQANLYDLTPLFAKLEKAQAAASAKQEQLETAGEVIHG